MPNAHIVVAEQDGALTEFVKLSGLAVWARLLQQVLVGLEQAYQRYGLLNIVNTAQQALSGPGLLVIAWLADGIIANPGASHTRALIWALFAIPPLAAFVLGLLNGYHPLRAVVLACAALVMIGVWYAVLILPAASRGGRARR